MASKIHAVGLALSLALLGLAGAATAPHYTADPVNKETAVRDYEGTTSPLATHNDDPIGITGDGSIDTSGVIFPACSPDNNEGSYNYGLRCAYTDDTDADGELDPMPDGPYDRAEAFVNDQVTTSIYILLTTCSEDGDNVCGETANVNDTATPGPNELRQGACTPDSAAIARNPNDPADGTGPGVWNQTDEMYDADDDGTAESPHPGVAEVVVFVLDPIWETLFTDDACDGVSQYSTQGTVTIVGT